jgi:hypothetical protein
LILSGSLWATLILIILGGGLGVVAWPSSSAGHK